MNMARSVSNLVGALVVISKGPGYGSLGKIKHVEQHGSCEGQTQCMVEIVYRPFQSEDSPGIGLGTEEEPVVSITGGDLIPCYEEADVSAPQTSIEDTKSRISTGDTIVLKIGLVVVVAQGMYKGTVGRIVSDTVGTTKAEIGATLPADHSPRQSPQLYNVQLFRPVVQNKRSAAVEPKVHGEDANGLALSNGGLNEQTERHVNDTETAIGTVISCCMLDLCLIQDKERTALLVEELKRSLEDENKQEESRALNVTAENGVDCDGDHDRSKGALAASRTTEELQALNYVGKYAVFLVGSYQGYVGKVVGISERYRCFRMSIVNEKGIVARSPISGYRKQTTSVATNLRIVNLQLRRVKAACERDRDGGGEEDEEGDVEGPKLVLCDEENNPVQIGENDPGFKFFSDSTSSEAEKVDPAAVRGEDIVGRYAVICNGVYAGYVGKIVRNCSTSNANTMKYVPLSLHIWKIELVDKHGDTVRARASRKKIHTSITRKNLELVDLELRMDPCDQAEVHGHGNLDDCRTGNLRPVLVMQESADEAAAEGEGEGERVGISPLKFFEEPPAIDFSEELRDRFVLLKSPRYLDCVGQLFGLNDAQTKLVAALVSEQGEHVRNAFGGVVFTTLEEGEWEFLDDVVFIPQGTAGCSTEHAECKDTISGDPTQLGGSASEHLHKQKCQEQEISASNDESTAAPAVAPTSAASAVPRRYRFFSLGLTGSRKQDGVGGGGGADGDEGIGEETARQSSRASADYSLIDQYVLVMSGMYRGYCGIVRNIYADGRYSINLLIDNDELDEETQQTAIRSTSAIGLSSASSSSSSSSSSSPSSSSTSKNVAKFNASDEMNRYSRESINTSISAGAGGPLPCSSSESEVEELRGADVLSENRSTMFCSLKRPSFEVINMEDMRMAEETLAEMSFLPDGSPVFASHTLAPPHSLPSPRPQSIDRSTTTATDDADDSADDVQFGEGGGCGNYGGKVQGVQQPEASLFVDATATSTAADDERIEGAMNPDCSNSSSDSSNHLKVMPTSMHSDLAHSEDLLGARATDRDGRTEAGKEGTCDVVTGIPSLSQPSAAKPFPLLSEPHSHSLSQSDTTSSSASSSSSSSDRLAAGNAHIAEKHSMESSTATKNILDRMEVDESHDESPIDTVMNTSRTSEESGYRCNTEKEDRERISNSQQVAENTANINGPTNGLTNGQAGTKPLLTAQLSEASPALALPVTTSSSSSSAELTAFQCEDQHAAYVSPRQVKKSISRSKSPAGARAIYRATTVVTPSSSSFAANAPPGSLSSSPRGATSPDLGQASPATATTAGDGEGGGGLQVFDSGGGDESRNNLYWALVRELDTVGESLPGCPQNRGFPCLWYGDFGVQWGDAIEVQPIAVDYYAANEPQPQPPPRAPPKKIRVLRQNVTPLDEQIVHKQYRKVKALPAGNGIMAPSYLAAPIAPDGKLVDGPSAENDSKNDTVVRHWLSVEDRDVRNQLLLKDFLLALLAFAEYDDASKDSYIWPRFIARMLADAKRMNAWLDAASSHPLLKSIGTKVRDRDAATDVSPQQDNHNGTIGVSVSASDLVASAEKKVGALVEKKALGGVTGSGGSAGGKGAKSASPGLGIANATVKLTRSHVFLFLLIAELHGIVDLFSCEEYEKQQQCTIEVVEVMDIVSSVMRGNDVFRAVSRVGDQYQIPALPLCKSMSLQDSSGADSSDLHAAAEVEKAWNSTSIKSDRDVREYLGHIHALRERYVAVGQIIEAPKLTTPKFESELSSAALSVAASPASPLSRPSERAFIREQTMGERIYERKVSLDRAIAHARRQGKRITALSTVKYILPSSPASSTSALTVTLPKSTESSATVAVADSAQIYETAPSRLPADPATVTACAPSGTSTLAAAAGAGAGAGADGALMADNIIASSGSLLSRDSSTPTSSASTVSMLPEAPAATRETASEDRVTVSALDAGVGVEVQQQGEAPYTAGWVIVFSGSGEIKASLEHCRIFSLPDDEALDILHSVDYDVPRALELAEEIFSSSLASLSQVGIAHQQAAVRVRDSGARGSNASTRLEGGGNDLTPVRPPSTLGSHFASSPLPTHYAESSVSAGSSDSGQQTPVDSNSVLGSAGNVPRKEEQGNNAGNNADNNSGVNAVSALKIDQSSVLSVGTASAFVPTIAEAKKRTATALTLGQTSVSAVAGAGAGAAAGATWANDQKMMKVAQFMTSMKRRLRCFRLTPSEIDLFQVVVNRYQFDLRKVWRNYNKHLIRLSNKSNAFDAATLPQPADSSSSPLSSASYPTISSSSPSSSSAPFSSSFAPGDKRAAQQGMYFCNNSNNNNTDCGVDNRASPPHVDAFNSASGPVAPPLSSRPSILETDPSSSEGSETPRHGTKPEPPASATAADAESIDRDQAAAAKSVPSAAVVREDKDSVELRHRIGCVGDARAPTAVVPAIGGAAAAAPARAPSSANSAARMRIRQIRPSFQPKSHKDIIELFHQSFVDVNSTATTFVSLFGGSGSAGERGGERGVSGGLGGGGGGGGGGGAWQSKQASSSSSGSWSQQAGNRRSTGSAAASSSCVGQRKGEKGSGLGSGRGQFSTSSAAASHLGKHNRTSGGSSSSSSSSSSSWALRKGGSGVGSCTKTTTSSGSSRGSIRENKDVLRDIRRDPNIPLRWPSSLPLMKNNLYWLKARKLPCICLGLDPVSLRTSREGALRVINISCASYNHEAVHPAKALEPLDREVLLECADERTIGFAEALMRFCEWELTETMQALQVVSDSNAASDSAPSEPALLSTAGRGLLGSGAAVEHRMKTESDSKLSGTESAIITAEAEAAPVSAPVATMLDVSLTPQLSGQPPLGSVQSCNASSTIAPRAPAAPAPISLLPAVSVVPSVVATAGATNPLIPETSRLRRWYCYPEFILQLVRRNDKSNAWRSQLERSVRGRKLDRGAIYFDGLVSNYRELPRAEDVRFVEELGGRAAFAVQNAARERGAVSDLVEIGSVYPWDDAPFEEDESDASEEPGDDDDDIDGDGYNDDRVNGVDNGRSRAAQSGIQDSKGKTSKPGGAAAASQQSKSSGKKAEKKPFVSAEKSGAQETDLSKTDGNGGKTKKLVKKSKEKDEIGNKDKGKDKQKDKDQQEAKDMESQRKRKKQKVAAPITPADVFSNRELFVDDGDLAYFTTEPDTEAGAGAGNAKPSSGGLKGGGKRAHADSDGEEKRSSTKKKARSSAVDTPEPMKSSTTPSSSSSSSSSTALVVSNAKSKPPRPPPRVMTQEEKWIARSISPLNLYWLRRSLLPCLYYDEESEADTAEAFVVLPICCETYHYPVKVKRGELEVLNDKNLRQCAGDERTVDFTSALIEFTDWEKKVREDMDRVRMLILDNEDERDQESDSENDDNSAVARNDAPALDSADFDAAASSAAASPSPELYHWPEFVLQLLNHPKEWSSWRKRVERKMVSAQYAPLPSADANAGGGDPISDAADDGADGGASTDVNANSLEAILASVKLSAERHECIRGSSARHAAYFRELCAQHIETEQLSARLELQQMQ